MYCGKTAVGPTSKVPDKEQDPYNWNDNLSKLLIGIVTILEPDMEFDKYFTPVRLQYFIR